MMRQFLLVTIISFWGWQVVAQQPYVQVLGVAQDGGYPHAGCAKQCCKMAWANAAMRRYVVSLALVDPATRQWWLLEATPDIKEQLHLFNELTKGVYNYLPSGIFLTHAHIGHYTGLMQLGREVMNTKDVPVYTLPKFRSYLENNGPWGQLVNLGNISLKTLDTNSAVVLTDNISVMAFTVPHRDEYSETAGFRIRAGGKKYLFIPDINKWDRWHKSIVAEVKAVDVALVDATFYDDSELPISSKGVVLHPFVTETLSIFGATDVEAKAKVYLIHFNHTNPILWNAARRKEIVKKGFCIAEEGEVL